jgi:hypothetical protein
MMNLTRTMMDQMSWLYTHKPYFHSMNTPDEAALGKEDQWCYSTAHVTITDLGQVQYKHKIKVINSNTPCLFTMIRSITKYLKMLKYAIIICHSYIVPTINVNW